MVALTHTPAGTTPFKLDSVLWTGISGPSEKHLLNKRGAQGQKEQELTITLVGTLDSCKVRHQTTPSLSGIQGAIVTVSGAGRFLRECHLAATQLLCPFPAQRWSAHKGGFLMAHFLSGGANASWNMTCKNKSFGAEVLNLGVATP